MKYKYLVSGFYGMNNGQTGFSENVVENNRKLNNVDEIDKGRMLGQVQFVHIHDNILILTTHQYNLIHIHP